MLKTGLQLKIGQSLALTPQLQQTIKLLQYSALELQNQVQEMIEQNPLLELDEKQPGAPDSSVDGESEPSRALKEDQPVSMDQQDSIPDELPVDSDWESVYTNMPTPRPMSSDTDLSAMLENIGESEESLRQHLYAQLELTHLSDIDRVIGHAIIDAVRDDGYLGESLEDLHDCLRRELDSDIQLAELEAVRKLIMQFDPLGCGALDLRENLLLQLAGERKSEPSTEHARLILTRFFVELEKQDLKRLVSRSRLSVEEVEAALEVIRSLKPRPGSAIGGHAADYVKPDVFVLQREGRWVASINSEVSPQLRIHPYYSSLVKRGDSSGQNKYLRDHLQEARWFLKSIQSRNETILKVAEVIVDKQQEFFERGEEAMRPMILRDVAEIVGMHESTISRVTSSKYMLTPRGLLSFKYFFSTQLGTSDGGNTSATAIRAQIRGLIEKENRQKPLSDSKITSILLNEKGIKVARRTVAKYREAMKIPPSSERKRIA